MCKIYSCISKTLRKSHAIMASGSGSKSRACHLNQVWIQRRLLRTSSLGVAPWAFSFISLIHTHITTGGQAHSRPSPVWENGRHSDPWQFWTPTRSHCQVLLHCFCGFCFQLAGLLVLLFNKWFFHKKEPASAAEEPFQTASCLCKFGDPEALFILYSLCCF